MAGNAPRVSTRATRRAAHRTLQPLPLCIRSKLARNGRQRATAEKSNACTCATRIGLRLASRGHPRHFLTQGFKRNSGQHAPRVEDDAPTRCEQMLLQTHSLAHPSADAVAHDRFSERPWRSKSEMRSVAGTGGRRSAQQESRKARTGHTSPFVIHFAEVTRFEDAGALRESTVVRRALQFCNGVRRQLWRSGRPVRR